MRRLDLAIEFAGGVGDSYHGQAGPERTARPKAAAGHAVAKETARDAAGGGHDLCARFAFTALQREGV